jgi:hypothetical protein
VPAGKRGGANDGHADYLLGAPRWLLRGAFQAPRPQNNARSAPGSKIHHLPPPGSHFETDSKLSQYQKKYRATNNSNYKKTVKRESLIVPNKVTNVITKRSFCHPNNLLGFREYQSKRLDKREGEDVDPTIQWTSPAVLLT